MALHSDGSEKPFVGLVLFEPRETALVPRPKAAKASHSVQTSAPPKLSIAAWITPSRLLTKVGEQAVFLKPSLT